MRNLRILILSACVSVFITIYLPYLYSSGIEHKRTYTAEDKGKDIYGLKNSHYNFQDTSAETEKEETKTDTSISLPVLPASIIKNQAKTGTTSSSANEQEDNLGQAKTSQKTSAKSTKIISQENVPLGCKYETQKTPAKSEEIISSENSPLGKNYKIVR